MCSLSPPDTSRQPGAGEMIDHHNGFIQQRPTVVYGNEYSLLTWMVEAVMAGATMEVAGELTMVVSGLGLITAAGAVNILAHSSLGRSFVLVCCKPSNAQFRYSTFLL